MDQVRFLSILVLLISSITTTSFANECQILLNEQLLKRPNRIYFGPEFLAFQANTHVNNVHVEGNRFFWGLRLGYEYLKPQSFYAAAELFAANTARNFAVGSSTLSYGGKGGAGFGSIQTRFGYTVSGLSCLLTPYAGLGVYSLSKNGHNGFQEGMGYVSGGLRTQFGCSPRLSVALNTELFRTLGVKQTVQLEDEKTTRHTNGWGCNVGIPLTVRLSPGWSAQVAPYFLRLLFAETQNIYGTTLLFGYQF